MPKATEQELSNGVTISAGGTRFWARKPKKKTTTSNRTLTQIQHERVKHAYEVSVLSWTARQSLFFDNQHDAMATDYDGDTAMSGPSEPLQDDDNDADWEDEDLAGLNQLPPGEEGFLQSHAGGEAILQQIMEGVSFSKRYDSRTRRDRIQRRIDAWRNQIPLLAVQYLDWKLHGLPGSPSVPASNWDIEVLTFGERISRRFQHLPNASFTNETLVRHGFLGASPDKPVLAISIELLEIYRQLRRVCPRLSLDAFARALCHIHHLPRQPHLADQISSAYDCYLEIQRHIGTRKSEALGRSPDWEQQNVCAPCLYRTTDEPPLKFSFLAAMDGNNSLKLVDSTFRPGSVRHDNRAFMSSRWISAEGVDVFKNEVHRKPPFPASANDTASVPPSINLTASTSASNPAPSATSEPNVTTPTASASTSNSQPDALPDADLETEDTAWLNVAEMDDLAKCVNACVERWRAAGPEARKKMFALFAVAGIFLAVCRHGHVLVICDMIRSGELMKYPIAIVDRLMEQYGSDICLGYDIMCAFIKTLSRSVLGPKIAALNLRGVVPSFHGHAHNRGCQLYWHPMYVEGVGLEDFEECERTFAKSNELASVTRLASPFHRIQHIDEHFMFRDHDKHAMSGNFILQNYRQALDKIATESQELAALEKHLKTTDVDYERYIQAERDHLQSLKSEPKDVQQAIDYLELFDGVIAAKKESDEAAAQFQKLDRLIIYGGITAKEIAHIRTRYRTTFTRFKNKEEELARHEEEHGIEQRWEVNSQVYRDTAKLLVERSYKRALDNLERLVVQRLFELTKLGMNGVGYKLREKINRALHTRASAIKTALKQYNDAAALLVPPREPLTWSTVMKAATVADFDLLRDTRTDIRCLPWTEPARREATAHYFSIKRAKEEIVRLNVEITRLLTFMFDTHADFHHAIQRHLVSDPPLAHSLLTDWQYQNRINETIVRSLKQTSQLKGFSGSLAVGTRLGRDPLASADAPSPQWMSLLQPGPSETHHDRDAGDEEDVPRELDIDTDVVVQLLENLHTTDNMMSNI